MLPFSYHSTEDEDNLLQGINSYRTSLNLPVLVKNSNAGCLADEIAEKLEHQPCTSASAASASSTPGAVSHLPNFPELVSKCKIDINTTRDAVILPACVHELVPTLVLTNFTHSRYSKFLNDSKFTGAGLGSEDDWMVVVLTTNTPGGSFASGSGSGVCSKIGALAILVVGLVVYFFGI